MADFPSAEMRISDAERESAMNALGEHMTSGRLDIDEYGERSAQVTAAKTRGELQGLFTDLPGPHPRFGSTTPAPAVPEQPTSAADIAPVWNRRPVVQRAWAGLVPVSALVGIALAATLHVWLFVLLPVAVVMFGGALWGEGWRHDRRAWRHQQHQIRREMRRRYRD